MAVNKVNYGGDTLIDLTGDTVTRQTLAKGVTAHDASGTQIVGAMATDGSGITVDTQPVKNSTNAISSGWAYSFTTFIAQALEEASTTFTQINQKLEELENRLGGLSFQKSATEPSVSMDENMITFVDT